jgi:hypothetical protein
VANYRGGFGVRGGFTPPAAGGGVTLPDPDTEPELLNDTQNSSFRGVRRDMGRPVRGDIARPGRTEPRPERPAEPPKSPEQLAEEQRQEMLRDRNFPGESIKNDTEFTAVIAVVLDPRKPETTEDK